MCGRILRPPSSHGLLTDPLIQIALNFRQIDENVGGRAKFGVRSTRVTFWGDQIDGIEKFFTSIALISSRVGVGTQRTGDFNETIGEEG